MLFFFKKTTIWFISYITMLSSLIVLLQAELQRMKQQAAESKTQLEQMEKEVAKLQQVIRESDGERKRQMKELDQVRSCLSNDCIISFISIRFFVCLRFCLPGHWWARYSRYTAGEEERWACSSLWKDKDPTIDLKQGWDSVQTTCRRYSHPQVGNQETEKRKSDPDQERR